MVQHQRCCGVSQVVEAGIGMGLLSALACNHPGGSWYRRECRLWSERSGNITATLGQTGGLYAGVRIGYNGNVR